MRRSISADDLIVLQHVADRAARRTRHRLGLPEQDLDDLRQDLLLDLIARFPAYDAKRGALQAFAYIVARNQTSRIGRAVWRERQLYGRMPVSIDTPLAGNDGAVIADLIPESQGFGALFDQSFNVEDKIVASASLDVGLSGLAETDRRLCAALVTATIDQLAASGHGARASLYRRLKNIRMALLAHGVEPA
jgi:hypothetical protein